MNDCYFVCIDIVEASKNIDEQEENLKLLLNFVRDFLIKNNIDPSKSAAYTGDGLFIEFLENDLLPLKLAVSLQLEFRKPEFQNFKFKTGIGFGNVYKIKEAELFKGLPYWGEAPTVAKRLCDLCDSYHILINDKAERKFRELIDSQPNFLLNNEYQEVFQDIGRYYVKHKHQLEIFNFYLRDKQKIVGNLSLPLDKRGIIDRLPINEKLSRPLDFFFEREAYDLVDKINNEEGLMLFIKSVKRLYESLFEDAEDYYEINKILPSQFFEYYYQFLIKHAEIVRNKKGTSGIRIMLMTKEKIRKDWFRNDTRVSNTNFIRFHQINKIKLLQINPYVVQEQIVPKLVSKYNSYLESSHIGIWKDRYMVLFDKLDTIVNSDQLGQKMGKFWIFNFDRPEYRYCQDLFNELLDYKKYDISEITLDDMNKPVFTRWSGSSAPNLTKGL